VVSRRQYRIRQSLCLAFIWWQGLDLNNAGPKILKGSMPQQDPSAINDKYANEYGICKQ